MSRHNSREGYAAHIAARPLKPGKPYTLPADSPLRLPVLEATPGYDAECWLCAQKWRGLKAYGLLKIHRPADGSRTPECHFITYRGGYPTTGDVFDPARLEREESAS